MSRDWRLVGLVGRLYAISVKKLGETNLPRSSGLFKTEDKAVAERD